MYNESFCEKLQAVLEDEKNLERLAEAKDKDELKAVFSDLGLEISDEDLSNVSRQLEEFKDSEEFSEEVLENVSGGCILCGIALVGGCIVTAYIVYKIGKWWVDKKYGK